MKTFIPHSIFIFYNCRRKCNPMIGLFSHSQRYTQKEYVLPKKAIPLSHEINGCLLCLLSWSVSGKAENSKHLYIHTSLWSPVILAFLCRLSDPITLIRNVGNELNELVDNFHHAWAEITLTLAIRLILFLIQPSECPAVWNVYRPIDERSVRVQLLE